MSPRPKPSKIAKILNLLGVKNEINGPKRHFCSIRHGRQIELPYQPSCNFGNGRLIYSKGQTLLPFSCLCPISFSGYWKKGFWSLKTVFIFRRPVKKFLVVRD